MKSIVYLVPTVFIFITVGFLLAFRFEWYRCKIIQFNVMGINNDDFERLSDTVKDKILGAIIKVNIFLIIVSVLVSYFSMYLIKNEVLFLIIPNILNVIIFIVCYIVLNNIIKAIQLQ